MERREWMDRLCRITQPVLEALAAGKLRSVMPVECGELDRSDCTHLEAAGRTLAGIAPWLEGGSREGEEGLLRDRFAELARLAIRAATDPESPDYMNFSKGGQPLVDAAFLAHAIIRAPKELLGKLDDAVRDNLIKALQATRVIKPAFNNWLLFSAMVETALYHAGADWDRMRVDYALKQHEQWYAGDGAYSDGPSFHWDYYNSFVIQPMLLDVLDTLGDQYADWNRMREPVLARAIRYADIQERLISADGSFPPIGRSLVYRCGAFQHLAQMALREQLPEHQNPAQVRGALEAVIRRTIDAPDTFDANGWLTIGLHGSQPGLGEPYISTGSLYLCTTAFLPLGLPVSSAFWSNPDQPWTQRKLWGGASQSIQLDKAISQ